MKRHAFWIFLSLLGLVWLLFSCSEESLSAECGVPATVRDFTGLDGCGYTFELDDGTQLIAVWDYGWCGTPPLPAGATEDPLYNFQYVEGKKVLIGFEERHDANGVDHCQMGARRVKITCLEEVESVQL